MHISPHEWREAHSRIPRTGAGAKQLTRNDGCISSFTTVRKKGKLLSQPQANNQNPLSASEPWNLVADGYAETTMLVFEQFAEVAIAASKLKPNVTVHDVVCGPGTLALRLGWGRG